MRIYRMPFLVAIAFVSSYVATSDFGSCRNDLDTLRKVAAEASEAAGDAQSKLDDYDDCKSDPGTHDLMGDGCRSQKSDYESAVSDLGSKMDDLDRRLRDVQSSCGYDFSLNKLSATEAAARHLDAANQRLCLSFRHLTPLLSRQNALQMCQAQQSAEWCKSCLGP